MIMSDDDDGDLLQVAFPVECSDEEFDLDIPPTSGMEYLRRVQVEAKNCPSIVVADIDTKLFSDKQTVHIERSGGLHAAPSGLAPPMDWQAIQSANFAKVREKLCRYKAKLKKNNVKPSRKLPKHDDVEGWCQLCFGRLQVSRTNPAADGSSPVGDGGEVVPPLLSIVAHMDQPTVIHVLEYHVNWFEATGFTEEQGCWFYALLASLEKPLVPEACSLIRSLARNCANLRATMESPADPYLVPMNLLITLVAVYFEQSDLADPT